MSLALAPPTKRRKRSKPLVEDDIEAAEAVTHETVTKITRSGAAKKQTILVPLVPLTEHEEHEASSLPHPHDRMDLGGGYVNADADADADAGHGFAAKPSKVDINVAVYGCEINAAALDATSLSSGVRRSCFRPHSSHSIPRGVARGAKNMQAML